MITFQAIIDNVASTTMETVHKKCVLHVTNLQGGKFMLSKNVAKVVAPKTQSEFATLVKDGAGVHALHFTECNVLVSFRQPLFFKNVNRPLEMSIPLFTVKRTKFSNFVKSKFKLDASTFQLVGVEAQKLVANDNKRKNNPVEEAEEEEEEKDSSKRSRITVSKLKTMGQIIREAGDERILGLHKVNLSRPMQQCDLTKLKTGSKVVESLYGNVEAIDRDSKSEPCIHVRTQNNNSYSIVKSLARTTLYSPEQYEEVKFVHKAVLQSIPDTCGQMPYTAFFRKQVKFTEVANQLTKLGFNAADDEKQRTIKAERAALGELRKMVCHALRPQQRRMLGLNEHNNGRLDVIDMQLMDHKTQTTETELKKAKRTVNKQTLIAICFGNVLYVDKNARVDIDELNKLK